MSWRRRALHERERQARVTAFHEAAHGILGIALGCRVREISMTGVHGGFCDFAPVPDRVADRLRIAFAGPCVGYILSDDDLGCEGDFAVAREAVARLPVEQRQQAYESAFAWSRSAVLSHWREIESVAAALLEHGQLSGEQVGRILPRVAVTREQPSIDEHGSIIATSAGYVVTVASGRRLGTFTSRQEAEHALREFVSGLRWRDAPVQRVAPAREALDYKPGSQFRSRRYA
jgi:hypothetical protein